MTVRLPSLVKVGTHAAAHVSVFGTFAVRKANKDLVNNQWLSVPATAQNIPNANTFCFATFRVDGALMSSRRAL